MLLMKYSSLEISCSTMKNVILILALVAASQANVHRHSRGHPIGEAPTDYESRIVNGEVAVRGDFPHQAAVVADGRVFCGGSLIAPQWVLTSGHCVQGVATSWEVTLGGQQRSDNEPGRVTVVTADFVLHSGFQMTGIENDLTLLRLPAPVELSEWIQPIALPTWSDVNTTLTGATLIASGWGKTIDNTTQLSDDLTFVNMNVIDNAACKTVYGELITDSILCCTGPLGANTCNGDSGGPLILEDGVVGPKLIGVTSFVTFNGGCESGLASGFTRVTSHLEWISSNTGIVIQD